MELDASGVLLRLPMIWLAMNAKIDGIQKANEEIESYVFPEPVPNV